ncbi:HalOD1 output domain-containing protein [Halorarum salinum]|uniref:Halobacterial output domain-containing protein n=1 Tax=Halorarum salinum TaxID=2743089 RepID=A0A7D5QII9_9EURY|nr:HalOD1 output domain-containing protein [Halobaculum salinum]QLG63623.1 hypothetical protein HUG12_18570 [Halobaculum salinum]
MQEPRTVRPTATATDRPSLDVVDLIADREGTCPTDLSPPLNSVVDPDALDSLFRSSTREDSPAIGAVSFTYCGYDVHVRSDGEVSVTPT